jgi:hypothetical protein
MDVAHELAEYHAIQEWLRGKKPAPAGRTWRRTVVAAVTLPLPPTMRTSVLARCVAVADAAGVLPAAFVCVRFGFPLLLMSFGGDLILAMIESMGDTPGALQQLPVADLANAIIPVLSTVGLVAGGISTLVGLVAFVLNGR